MYNQNSSALPKRLHAFSDCPVRPHIPTHSDWPFHGAYTDLRGMTRGRGQFTMSFERFDVA